MCAIDSSPSRKKIPITFRLTKIPTTTQKNGGGSHKGAGPRHVWLSSSSKRAHRWKVLRAFQKSCTAFATIFYKITDRDVSNWDSVKGAFTVTRGVYTVYIGASSQDIRLKGTIEI